jgi:hypothetical protein
MKKFKSTCWKVALATFLFVFCGQAFAQTTIGADAAYKSKYIFRGLPWNTESVFWPDVWINFQGFTVILASSMNLTDKIGSKNKISEFDYYFDYTKTFDKASVSLGYAQYSYPNTVFASTGEIYLKTISDLKILTLTLSGYFDVRKAKGFYVSPKFSRAFPMAQAPGLTPSLSLSLGYGDQEHNAYWLGLAKAGLADFTGSLNLVYSPPGSLGKYMTFNGELAYARILDKDIAKLYEEVVTADGSKEDRRGNLWFGLGINLFTTVGGGQ